MDRYPNLSEPDRIIMDVIWRDGECSSAAILEETRSTLNWSRQTVRTYLMRLVDKGLVGTRAASARSFLYYPIVSKEEYAADKTEGLVDSYYGSVSHLLAGLLKKEKLSGNELDRLEELIQQARAAKKEE